MGALLKILLTLFVILVAYWLIKYRGRVSVLKSAVKAAKKTAAEAAQNTAATPDPAKTAVPVTLVACPKCGTYTTVGKACVCGG